MNNTTLYKGAGIWSVNSNNLNLVNNTIANNHCTVTSSYSLGGGLAITDSGSVIGKNNILYGNTCNNSPNIYGTPSFTYTCVENLLLPGIGNISQNPLFVTGISGAYYLSQIAAGQAVNSPSVDTGDPASPMITGTTRTDQAQDAGIVDMGCHYEIIAAPPPPVTITLMPVNPPILIPASGGSFNFTAAVTNTIGNPITFDAWTEAILPRGQIHGPIINRGGLVIPAGATITRTISQSVPGNAPAGNYFYVGKVGTYPNTVIDEDSFTFEKLAGDAPPAHNQDWAVYGFFGDPEFTAASTKFVLISASPNPFNPATTITFDLPEASKVNLSVYNISGSLVASLVNDLRDAGIHELPFDGSHRASGIYIISLQAGGYTASRKVVLMK